MPADDELDPLDRWLNQQVQPLPPPSGTFELITRRARHRKIRKAVISVASAAAVAAAVAVAVPVGMSLHLTTGSTNASLAAGTSPTSHGEIKNVAGGTESVSASAKPAVTAPSSTTGTGPFTEPSGPVPANFAPVSVTFVSTSHAWVIGQAGTPGQCANPTNPYICTSVAHTGNGGRTWAGGPAPTTTGPDGPAGVSGIRFLDGVNGWAFGPELWVTHDAGNHWAKIGTGGQRVTDLEAAGNRAYALFARCSGTNAASFAYGCTSYTLMTATADSNQWTPVGGATNGLTSQGAAATGVIALIGTTGYLVAPDGTLYSGPLGGTWQQAGTMPCRPGTPQANGLPGDALIALISATRLATFCAGPTPTAAPKVYTSSDSGATWALAGDWAQVSGQYYPTSIAATSSGTLLLTTIRGIYLLTQGAAHWAASSATGAPPGGFSYVGMTTSEQGVALPFSTSRHEIWMTFDGGRTWTPATSITPGN